MKFLNTMAFQVFHDLYEPYIPTLSRTSSEGEGQYTMADCEKEHFAPLLFFNQWNFFNLPVSSVHLAFF